MSKNVPSNYQKKLPVAFAISLLLFLNSLHSYAKSQIPDVTINGKNITLLQIIKSIEKQTGLLVKFNSELCNLDLNNKYSLSFNKAQVGEVISFVIHSSDLSFEIVNKTLIIFPVKKSIRDSIPVSTINGTVRDNVGNAIPGVSIKIKDTKKGTITDNFGRFTLSDISKGDKIVLSSVGYETKEISANDKNIIAELNPFVNNLNETQIIAYGRTTKRLNTGNVSTIKASQIEDLPVSNPMLAIQGRIPGMDVVPVSGLPGAAVKISIQGTNSLFFGNDPLIVIDNVPYPSQPFSSGTNPATDGAGILGSSGNPGQLGSTLSFINTSDIESIDILKGADATSIYGSRAANGAILITTKKGQKGKTKVTFSFQQGFSKIGKELKVMNKEEYLEMRKEAFNNDGRTPGPRDYDLNGAFDTTKSHDWQRELLGNTGHNLIAGLSISGGTENVNYLVAGGYSKQTSIFPEFFNSYYDQRASVHTSITATTPNKRFMMTFISDYMNDLNKLPEVDYVSISQKLSPIYPDLIDANGQINWKASNPNIEIGDNPISNSLVMTQSTTNNLISNISLSYQIADGLKILGNIGYNRLEQEDLTTSPTGSIPPSLINFGVRNSSSVNTRAYTTWNLEPQISYDKILLQKHKFHVLLGSTITRVDGIARAIFAQGYSSDLLLKDISSASSLGPTYSDNTIYKYAAAFGRLTYNFNDKYIIQATGRRDGSSRYGPENRYHSFGSVGGAWLFSEEPFIKKALPFLFFGKLRTSYGSSGNDQIENYNFLTLYQAAPAYRPYQGILGMEATGISNPYLQWEKVNKFEVGLEAGFLENRISLTANFGLNRSSNQIISTILPSISGFGAVNTNLAAKVQNRLWEFNLSTVNIQSPVFKWNSIITLTLPKNKILDFPGLKESPLYSNAFVIGQPINARRFVKSAGINDSTGLYQFYNNKGEIVSSPDMVNDAVVIRNLDPKFYGAFTNTISYKSITLSFSFYAKEAYTMIRQPNRPPGNFDVTGQNVPTIYLDRWQKTGDKAKYPKYTTTTNASYTYYGRSDGALFNQYFIRCSYITLGWELPEEWKKSLRMTRCNINTQIMNPFVITNNKIVLDPESGYAIPPLKIFTFGIKATF